MTEEEWLACGDLGPKLNMLRSSDKEVSQMEKMTEHDWLTTTNPYDLTHSKACRSDRKRRLFSCAVARRFLHLIPDDRYQEAIELAERYADVGATEEEMRVTRRVMKKAWNERQFMEAGNFAATA